MTKFLLIRHATNDTVGHRLAGRQPGVNLNEEGQGQAQSLARRLAGLPLAGIYSSPLERTLQTAEILGEKLSMKPQVWEDFLEIDFGEWTNRTFEELQPDQQFQRFNTFRSSTRIPGGELMPEAQTRMLRGINRLCNQHPQEMVAIVSHSDLIKSALAYYAGIPLDLFQRIEISPASVSILEVHELTARILLVNHTGEIEAF